MQSTDDHASQVTLAKQSPISSSGRRRAFWAGVRAEAPILIGTIPFGLIYGVLSQTAHLPPVIALAMSSIVFAGSAQFIAAQLIATGAPGLVIMLTTAIVNLRHLLYSASVATYLKPLNRWWRVVLAYLLTDEAYAVAIAHYIATDRDQSPPHIMANRHWYFLGAGLALWSTWQLSSAFGIFLGAQVSPSLSLDFTLALTFIALTVPALKDRPAVAAAIAAGLVAVLCYGLPYKLGLMVAALIGIGVGLWLETRLMRRQAAVSKPIASIAPDNHDEALP